MQKTLIIIKPCAIQHKNEIFKELDKHGQRIITEHIQSTPQEIIEKHYNNKKQEDITIFNRLLKHFTGKPVTIAIYQGEDIIQKFMDITGSTEPKQGTLRGRFSDDTFEKAGKEDRSVYNAIHRSGSAEEAEYEIKIWQEFLKSKNL